MNPIQFVRIAVINGGNIKPDTLPKSALMSYVDNKRAFITDVPQIMVVFTDTVVAFEDGMSLSALPTLNNLSGVCIVQHNDGTPRDFDYVGYGHILNDLAKRDHGKKDPVKTTIWPVIAPGCK